MKLNQFVLLGVTALFTSVLSISGSASGVLANPSPNAANPLLTSPGTNATVAQNQTPRMLSGTFVAAEKPTTGTARIVTDNGHRYLELNGAFSTSNQGPDLHVLLETSAKPPQMYQNPGSYVNLGKLQKFKGTQRYPIPDAINLSEFNSVVIWCRMANATFGYATLGGTSRASN
jgi:hypothetical protein